MLPDVAVFTRSSSSGIFGGMRTLSFVGSASVALVFLACGGSQPAPSDASAEPPVAAPVEAPSAPAGDSAEGDAPSDEPKPETSAKAEPKDPEFKENGSVDEAIAAVPVSSDRLNIDQETLGKPLQDPALYEPCKPGNAKFKFRVAVWNGKAVGLDMSSTPKNPKLEECIKGRIRELTWRDKVRALNTVEYQF
jgi:hypothetical protein